jgi:hypothetical protein
MIAELFWYQDGKIDKNSGNSLVSTSCIIVALVLLCAPSVDNIAHSMALL